jgi:hypothetical protein
MVYSDQRPRYDMLLSICPYYGGDTVVISDGIDFGGAVRTRGASRIP